MSGLPPRASPIWTPFILTKIKAHSFSIPFYRFGGTHTARLLRGWLGEKPGRLYPPVELHGTDKTQGWLWCSVGADRGEDPGGDNKEAEVTAQVGRWGPS